LLQGILAKSTMRRKLGLNFLSFLLRTWRAKNFLIVLTEG
jgi:hypothetical protein